MKFISSAVFIALAVNSVQGFTVSAPATVNKVGFSNADRLAFSNAPVSAGVNSNRMSQREVTALAAEVTKITMPALSSTMKEGRVVSWLKAEGDEVEAGEAIMVVESDKADMDVEAFEDGFIAKILVQEGESAPVGNVVALLVAEESDIAAASRS
jgi:pyruvate dehydrogenase E2 component (dihydrolipoamide acetyltransferase)